MTQPRTFSFPIPLVPAALATVRPGEAIGNASFPIAGLRGFAVKLACEHVSK